MSDSNSQNQPTSDSQSAAILEWEQGVVPTENQLRVAKDLGADAAVLERMKSEGMNRSTYYHVIPAEAAEEHMGAKYGISFRATDAVVDSDEKANEVRVTVEPEQGDYAGRDFTVRVKWTADSGPDFSENYFRAARNDEYAAHVEGLLEGAVTACPHEVRVVAELAPSLSVGDRYDGKTPIADVAASCDGRISVVFAPASDMDKKTYQTELAAILKAACSVNPALFYEACYVEKLEPIDKTFDAATAMSYLYAVDGERRALCVWRTYGSVSDDVA